MKKKEIRVFEAFAGFGGASFGLRKAGIKHRVVMYSEWDKWAQELFEANHNYPPLFADIETNEFQTKGDMTKGDFSSIPEFDLFTGGFPCQPFSSAGLGKGELDPRGTLFYSIIQVLESFDKDSRPKYVLLENVKGMTHKKHKPTFDKIKSMLEELNYKSDDKVLNSLDFGVPQNRERLWIFAERNDLHKDRLKRNNGKEFFDVIKDKYSIDARNRPKFHDYLDPQNKTKVSEEHFLKDYQVEKLIDKHNMPLHEFLETGHKRSLCLDIYNKKLKKEEISITLTEPHHNSLRVVEHLGHHKGHQLTTGEKARGYTVRKLTIKEHYRLMGFVDGKIELNQNKQSYQQLCKRAGNGWDINVASIIFKEIFEKEIL